MKVLEENGLHEVDGAGMALPWAGSHLMEVQSPPSTSLSEQAQAGTVA